MTLETLVTYLRSFYYNHTIAAIAVGAAIILLVCLRPKAMLKVVGLILAFLVVAYLSSLAIDMAGSGRAPKRDMIHTAD